MKCPFCGHMDSKVIDSRPTDEGKMIRRRRECLECEKRFTTYETIDLIPITVIKRSKDRQTFDRDKLKSGIVRSCINLPISMETIDSIVDKIENEIQNSLEKEVSSNKIAEKAMRELKEINEVAYVRFASVTNSFSDVNSFLELLNELKNKK